MFEQVRKTGAALAFVLGTHLVRDAYGIHRRVVVLGDEHSQTILKTRVGELDMGSFGRSLCQRHTSGGQHHGNGEFHETS